MRSGITYQLEVEREGNTSDHACAYKLRVGTTYVLEMEEGGTSDRRRLQCRHNVRPGGGERGRYIRQQLRVQNKGRDDAHTEGGEAGTCQIGITKQRLKQHTHCG